MGRATRYWAGLTGIGYEMGQAPSAEVGVQPQYGLMAGSPLGVTNGGGMEGTSSAGAAVPIPHQWLRLSDGQLVTQPAVAQQLFTAQHGGMMFGATAASVPPPQQAEVALAGAQLVAPPQEAAVGAPQESVKDDAWVRRRYRVPPHALADTIAQIAERHLSAATVLIGEIIEFAKSLREEFRDICPREKNYPHR